MSPLSNIYYISDLHWNVWCRNYATHIFRYIVWNRFKNCENTNLPLENCVLVIAGDISPLIQPKESFVSFYHNDILTEFKRTFRFSDIVWHAGNHEFDTSNIVHPDILNEYRQIAYDTQTHFLHRSIYTNNKLKVEVGGCVLWTPSRYKEEYKYDLDFIRYYSYRPKKIGWRRILSTHYLPIPELIHSKYKNIKFDNRKFANNLLEPQYKIAWNHIDVSICGHTHTSMSVEKQINDFHKIHYGVYPIGYPIESNSLFFKN